ncbi:alpha/beta hydrolase [Arthrobacter burdickii]|uniref:Alpha/beta hydrolase n=1 Tax=Arthrobacter burdickii TaxID=3035920 RepID=A0ABT8K4N3_9MICC|nr:alpha/beta hydrolase [Arthrobacter burdickii]MDN4611507.1 alpha/beta hydrolase [Arthrobacter burdickii]
MDELWSEDILGGSFRALTLPLEPDDEGPRVATLVAYEPDDGPAGDDPQQGGPTRAVLYVHGFSDYFLHTELARTLHARGWAFFALDLHKYGRSLLPGQTPGFTTSLDDYDADLEAAIAALTDRLAARRDGDSAPASSTASPAASSTACSPTPTVDLVLMAHSTGGLTTALWAARNPGRIAALVLNSPWLDTPGSAQLRSAAQGILAVSRRRPKTRLRLPELGFYFRSISDTRDGEWSIDPAWRPEAGFPIRAGWLAAVLAGHAALARGVSIDVPVLVLCSKASTISTSWNSAMLETDSVLDVTPMVRRAAELGPNVTIRRLPGALHDVLLSRREVRTQAVGIAAWWLDVYVPACGPCREDGRPGGFRP